MVGVGLQTNAKSANQVATFWLRTKWWNTFNVVMIYFYRAKNWHYFATWWQVLREGLKKLNIKMVEKIVKAFSCFSDEFTIKSSFGAEFSWNLCQNLETGRINATILSETVWWLFDELTNREVSKVETKYCFCDICVCVYVSVTLLCEHEIRLLEQLTVRMKCNLVIRLFIILLWSLFVTSVFQFNVLFFLSHCILDLHVLFCWLFDFSFLSTILFWMRF